MELQRLAGDHVHPKPSPTIMASQPQTEPQTDPEARKTKDQTDYAPQPMQVTNCDIFWLLFSIGSHFVDIGTDINVAYQYWSHGEEHYFIATVVVVCIPSIINSLVSWRMYVMDSQEVSPQLAHHTACRCLVLIFQLAPVLRYYDSLKFALKSRAAEKEKNKKDQEHYYRLMLKEDADVALLRVFECFLEAAPQQILQISFLLRESQPDATSFSVLHQFFSILSSLSGMALALLTYQRNIRFAQEDKDNITFRGSIFLFLWHFCITVSRILMWSAVASIFWRWTLLAMFIHWVLMTMHLTLTEAHEFCSSPMFERARFHERVANFCFSSVLGLVYLFTYVTPGEGKTFYRYLIYYTICLLENVGGTAVWGMMAPPPQNQWYYVPIMAACILLFTLGCMFMVIYYWKFHPRHYSPPSIIPQRRYRTSSGTSDLPVTPCPSIQNPSEIISNGTVCSGKELGGNNIREPEGLP